VVIFKAREILRNAYRTLNDPSTSALLPSRYRCSQYKFSFSNVVFPSFSGARSIRIVPAGIEPTTCRL
jgi:hypothetical protein